MSSTSIRILVADDHPIVRQGLSQLLELQPGMTIVAVARDGAEAVALARQHQPDVVLMDLMMPELDGVEATKALSQDCPETHVVVLTSHHQDAMVFPAIAAGATSYLLKSATPDEVIEAVRAAARGEARLSPRVAQRLMQGVRGDLPSAESLTTRELEVLRLVARGLDNQAIADELDVSAKTVKSHVSNVLGKLGLADRTQAAVYALRQGIAPLEEDTPPSG
jgi:NarL family two-component system response regulator LiaR